MIIRSTTSAFELVPQHLFLVGFVLGFLGMYLTAWMLLGWWKWWRSNGSVAEPETDEPPIR